MSNMSLTKFLILLFLFANVSIFAQNKPQALKFDEFAITDFRFYSDYDAITIAQRAERFNKQLKKERGVKAYIVYYQARVSEKNNGVSYLPERIKGSVLSRTLEHEDVVIVNGGYRENVEFEFWIVPKNAAPPEPTPTFTKPETFQCANLSVFGQVPLNETDEVIFSVSTYYLKEIENSTLTWKVSAGEIVEGQGLNSIKVKLNKSDPKQITAFLEVGGLPYPCPKVFTASAEIGNGKLFLIDSFGNLPSGETKARSDAFLTQLHNNSAAKGYIIIYGNRTQGARSIEGRIRFYKNYFTFRGADLMPINIIPGGYREETSSELWLSFDDEKPVPTPTVDAKFIEVPKAARKPQTRKK